LGGFLDFGLPPGIRRLSLHDNPILKSTQKSDRNYLEQLMNDYPQLGWIGWDLHLHNLHPQHAPTGPNDPRYKLFTAATTYMLLLNRCGRVLLCQDPNKSIPLSVGPTVLARRVRHELCYRVSRTRDVGDRAMECSVIYSLLQGPAFLSRPRG
jgi:hypothetical protein